MGVPKIAGSGLRTCSNPRLSYLHAASSWNVLTSIQLVYAMTLTTDHLGLAYQPAVVQYAQIIYASRESVTVHHK